MLDDITIQIYESTLPITVIGETRYSLIRSFQEYVGTEYTPINMDARLMWSIIDPFDMVDTTDLEWEKTFITHNPSKLFKSSKQVNLLGPQPGRPSLPSTIHESLNTWNVTPMKAAEKHKGRASDTFDIKQTIPDKCIVQGQASDTIFKQSMQDKHIMQGSVPVSPAGCKWSNNSCTYDAVLFVLYNLWKSDEAKYTTSFAHLRNRWMDMASLSFKKYIKGEYNLEEEYER
ncbi:uncharacterized protein EV420DRAFT_1645817 [Desarmillaria tabescens]|uniref:Uncharacterized protein n=1 Tax=Armillaria tabescens TaxID=1929756 RepID=A0AA39K2D1_ARMTA|nr:uncharacterized protein EV420DRAFT_1645817 [Desarmillaria tabescens]KAK0452175.1 hypothetical protein EV420DRAFT_1645817 [Desarmillaria tabescens]